MKRHFVELDNIRGLAIIGVIMIHITMHLTGVINLTINQSSRFSVPIFIFLSGLGLTIGNKMKNGYVEFLKQQTSKIIPLYFMWSVIYYFFGLVLKGESFVLSDFIKGLVIGGNYYHLYYVPLIMFFYLIYPLLLKIGKTKWGLMVTFLLTIVNQIAFYLTGHSFYNEGLNILNWLFYFVLGVWMANNFGSKLSKIKQYKNVYFFPLVLMFVVVSVESNFFMDTIGLGPSTSTMRPSVIFLSVFFILFNLSHEWKNSIMLILSKYSYGIYLSHVLILTVFNYVYKSIGLAMGTVLHTILAFIFVSVISVLTTIVIDRILKMAKVRLEVMHSQITE